MSADLAEDDQPPVICNPNAGPRQLVAWCMAEVYSLAATTEALAATTDATLGPMELHNIFGHRLQSLSSVLEYALDRLGNLDRPSDDQRRIGARSKGGAA